MDEVWLTRVAVVENLGLGHILGDEERGELGAKFVEVANKITACDGIDKGRGCNRGEGGFQVFGWCTLDELQVDHIAGLAFVGVGKTCGRASGVVLRCQHHRL